MRHISWRGSLAATALLALVACDEQGFDFDLRDQFSDAGGLDTTNAARGAIADRPDADDRGVISYPNYQVAVARRGDTVVDVAARVGLSADDLSRYNGIPLDATLRKGEVVALPERVAEPSPATGSDTTGPIVAPEDGPQALAEATAAQTETVEVAALAEDAIDRAEAAPPKIATGEEPVRHQVVAGETAFSIARRYDVPVAAIREWNGLDSAYTVRVGQFLLIPVSEPGAVVAAPSPAAPGEGSATPVPPSAADPLPDPADAAPPDATAEADAAAAPDLSDATTRAAESAAAMIYPAAGKIIRAYQKGRNDGIDIQTEAGAAVLAAAEGSVAAITRDTDQVPILVLRHDGNILTVYAGVDNIAVNKGDTVRRGQEIAKVRAGSPPVLHFEVRDGFDSVDPALYLE